jgi:hypothetical protein
VIRRLGFALIAIGGILLVAGLLGGALSGKGDAGNAAAPAVSAPTSHAPTATSGPDMARFVKDLAYAFRTGDSEFLFNNLDSAVVDRYGADACRSYVAGLSDPTRRYVAGEPGEPSSWAYKSDGATTSVPDVVSVPVSGTADGRSISAEQHFALLADGTVAWFTDCGTRA